MVKQKGRRNPRPLNFNRRNLPGTAFGVGAIIVFAPFAIGINATTDSTNTTANQGTIPQGMMAANDGTNAETQKGANRCTADDLLGTSAPAGIVTGITVTVTAAAGFGSRDDQ
jgi:hypothetical protein